MNFVITVHTYWPRKDGVQYVTQYLAEGLVKNGHQVTVITSQSQKKQVISEIHNGVLIMRPFLKTHYSIFVSGKNKYCKLVLDELVKSDCLINCCVQSPNNNVLLSVFKKIDCPKILYMHGMHNFRLPSQKVNFSYKLKHCALNIRWWLFYKWHRQKFLNYDAMIDIHEKSLAVSFMKEMGYKKPIYILQNAVENFENIEINGNDLHDAPLLDEKYFLYVANFVPGKNQELLIRSYIEVPDKQGYKLVLIGKSSEYSKKMIQLIKEKDTKNEVFLFEDISRELTMKYIKNCRCAVMSSLSEVFPIFICEAIMCAHPYISMNVGCVKQIPGGIIVENGQEMTQALQKIISDNELEKKLSFDGYTYAKNNLLQSEKIKEFEKILMKETKGNIIF